MSVGNDDLNRTRCMRFIRRREGLILWGDRLHHVVDARARQPVHDVVATWVVADNAALADGVATALFFTSGRELETSFPFSCVRLLASGGIEASTSFDGQLFISEQPARRSITKAVPGIT